MANTEHQLRILEALEKQPDSTQAGLAAQLGVAVGTVNWYLKRLIKKGYVKTKQLERRNLKYFVTPSGLALKARLTREYMEVSLRVYRQLRRAAQETLARIDEAGYDSVTIDGGGAGSEGAGVDDAGSEGAMEIFRLTCLEQGIGVDVAGVSAAPSIRADGRSFTVTWPDGAAASATEEPV